MTSVARYSKPSERSLGDLLPGVSADVAAIPVAGLCLDSRKIKPGQVFLALKGHAHDGRDHINAAVAAGAVAVIADAPCDTSAWSLPVLPVDQLAERVSEIAGKYFAHPSQAMRLIGITGTNGKTSCSWMLAQLLEAMGEPCGIVGTLGNGRLGDLKPAGNTTPDAVSIQALLASWCEGGARWASMEVSSHGLAQHRVEALHFDAAIFTNLSQDHLDYHGSMAAYAAAKARLFNWPNLGLAVINRDDEFGRQLIASAAASQIIDYSLSDAAAQIYVERLASDISGSRAVLHSPWGRIDIDTPLLGDFNLANLAAACGVLLARGIAPQQIANVLEALQPVPGRMQCLRSEDGVLVVIDYAHTEDALTKVLDSLRPVCSGQLLCVFGCGGERDRGKRPLMGRAAAAGADRLFVTSDNPRSEVPQDIIDDICAGISDVSGVEVEVDRERAILAAITGAQPGDVVLIAGKGHEQSQDIGGQQLPFSDLAVAHRAIGRREAI